MFIVFISLFLGSHGHDFIFTMGPPAAGKTGAANLWLREMRGIEINRNEIDFINVDDIVSANPDYDRETKNWMREHLGETHGNNLTSVSESLCNGTSQIYLRYREDADRRSNSRLLENLVNPTKTVIYETSGSNYAFGWMMGVAKLAVSAGFQIHLVFPVAHFEQLKERALRRAFQEGRLPCPNIIENINEQARANFS